jgi:hypothetical protein
VSEQPEVSTQIWTDEQLWQHLDEWDKMRQAGTTPAGWSFNMTPAAPRSYMGERYTIIYEHIKVVLTLSQASLVDRWLNRSALAPKHDGILDGQGFMHVRITSDDPDLKGKRQVVIMDDTFDGWGMSPGQFLSLMKWGEQNREEIERLAKEQGQ